MTELEKAIIFATCMHKGQVDKAGAPYILHPLRIMLRMETDEERIAAVLHDVKEDCGVTDEKLRTSGFRESVIEAVGFLTKRPEEENDYERFIQRICTGPLLAIRVKRADLEDNMDLARIKNPSEADRNRVQKYQRAAIMLKAAETSR